VIDLVVLFLIFVLALKGYFNGLMRELVGFVGLIGGVFVASRAAEPVGRTIHQVLNMGGPALLKLLGFLLVLGLIWGGSAFVGTIFSALKAPSHSVVSRTLGMGVAGIKYFLIFALISASLLNSALVRDNFAARLDRSRLFPVLNRVGSTLINLAPLSMEKKPAPKQASNKDGHRG
jgi:membrane protein required for colicin V production